MSATAPDTIEVCFHELFERQAALRPAHPAIICEGEELTYAQLSAQSAQLAWHLRALGAGPETLIPICVERSMAMAVGILGILRAGAAYVPVDPDYPAERIAFMLADTAAPLIVTQAHLAGRLAHSGARMVLLDQDGPAIRQHSTDNPPLNAGPEQAAYVIYTSGSTGQPKGTLLTHANLSHYVLALQDELQLVPEDRYLHLASIAFSSSRRHLMLPLSQGATVVIATQDERLDPLALFRLMKRHGVTVFDAVPSFQRHCTNTLLDLQPELRAELLENRVRLILSASEPLLSDVPQIWRQQFRHPAHHVHMFGQTETSGIVALHHLTDEDCAQIKVVPVGRPLARTQIYLLDENQQPVPDGEPGEICVSSAGLARGYLNRPELTAQKFIEWAVKDAPGHQPLTTNHSRLCRTGDFARRLPDGKLECLGRQDSQLKLRGFRIEPGEIEAVLAQHPDVRECVVAARQDQHGQPRLVAWVVPRRGSSVVSELRQMAQEQLPDYLRPAAFVPLAALPLTPNGKVDRRALPEPDESAFVTEQPYAAPRTETERLVAEIWAAVLGLRRVGIHDHFFELGGHSLLAGRVINRIRKTFQSEIPLRALFEAPTVAEFAARLEQALQDASAPQAPPLRRADRPAELPLSFAQQRLWFLAQLEPGTATYNLRRVVRISGQLNVEALRRAVQAIVRRHEILRTNFISIDGRPLQLIAPDFTADLPVSDLSHLPAAQRVAEAQRLAAAISARPFDLASDPLLRVELLRLSDEDHFLVTVFHHIISDGWSLGIFFRELGAFYRADIEGQDAALPALPVQYADYVLWEQETLREERTAELTAFWREQLSGAPARLELPTDHPRPPVQRYRGAQLSAQLSPQLSSELRALSQREGVTLFMTLLAAFQTLLHRYAQQEQILIGTPTAGRLALETEALIGFFVNTLVLRGDLSGEPTFRELLGRTRQRVLGALAHQELPFEKLVEELQPQRSLSYSPLFQVMFALQNAPVNGMEWGELKLNSVKLPGRTAKFDLSLDVFEEAVGLRLWLEYDLELFEAGTIRQMLADFETVLEAVTRDPQQRLSRLLPEKLSTACGRQPEPADSQPAEESELIAPRTPTEEIVVETYAGLLRLREVGVNEDFFELGGHSLLAARVIFRLRDLCGVQLSLRSIFETPTAAGLAAAIDEMLAAREQQELDELLAELESLSEDEAQQLLMEEVRQSSEPRWPGK